MTPARIRSGVSAWTLAALALCGAPLGRLGAQAALITMPKQAAERAAAASNAQLDRQMTQARAAEGRQMGPAQAAAAQAARAQSNGQQNTGQQGAAGKPSVVQSGAARPGDPKPAHPAEAPDPGNVIMREVFAYSTEGRRDPFFSLMATGDLRPMLSDLRLTTILYDLSGRRPVAVMNDLSTSLQYRVTTGMMLGRMRVTAIKPRKVIFAIDEFGFSRADSLVLLDKPQTRQ
jgi:hypothetical protein